MPELPDLLAPPENTPSNQEPEFDGFSTWVSKQPELVEDSVDTYKGYADYMRKSYINADAYDIDVEQNIRFGMESTLRDKGMLDPEDKEARASLYSSTDQVPLSDRLQLVRSTYSSETPEWEAASEYLAFQKALSPGDLDNPEIAARDEELRLRAEETSAGAYNTALRKSVKSGELAMAKVTNPDGTTEVIAGPLMDRMGFKEALTQGVKAGGMQYSDAFMAQNLLEPHAGYKEPKYKTDGYNEVATLLAELSKESEPVQGFLSRMQDVYLGLDENGVTPENQKRLGELKSTVLHFLNTSGLADEDIDPASFDKAVDQLVSSHLNNNGEFKFYDDPADAGKNLRTFGYGLPQVHPAAMANPESFKATLAAHPELSPQDVSMLEATRDQHLQANFDNYNKVLTKSSVSDEWLSTLQASRAKGVKDVDTLQGFLANPDNFNELGARFSGVGASFVDSFGAMVATIPAFSGADWAKDYLLKNNEQQANRREVARLFGHEFGLGQDIAEQIAPMLVDMAATAVLAAATTPAAGAGGAAYLAARQGARLTAKGLAKSLTSNVLREGGKDAAERLVVQGLITGSSKEVAEKGAMAAIKGYNSLTASKMGLAPAVFLPAANRSAGATYAGVYAQLQNNPDLTPEEVHDRSLGAALTAGAFTGVITSAFSVLGRGGLEAAFTQGLTRNQVKGVLTRLAANGDDTLSTLSEGGFNTFVRNRIGEALKAHGGWAGVGREIASNAWDESMEEGLDELLNTFVVDAYTDSETPFFERLQQTFHAAVIGGIMGGGVPSIRKVGEAVNANKRIAQAAPQIEEQFIQDLTNDLNESGNPLTAEVVRNLMEVPARNRDSVVGMVTQFKSMQQEAEALAAEQEAKDSEAAVAAAAADAANYTQFEAVLGEGIVPKNTPLEDLTPTQRVSYAAQAKAKELAPTEGKSESVGRTSIPFYIGNREVKPGTRLDTLTDSEIQVYNAFRQSFAEVMGEPAPEPIILKGRKKTAKPEPTAKPKSGGTRRSGEPAYVEPEVDELENEEISEPDVVAPEEFIEAARSQILAQDQDPAQTEAELEKLNELEEEITTVDDEGLPAPADSYENFERQLNDKFSELKVTPAPAPAPTPEGEATPTPEGKTEYTPTSRGDFSVLPQYKGAHVNMGTLKPNMVVSYKGDTVVVLDVMSSGGALQVLHPDLFPSTYDLNLKGRESDTRAKGDKNSLLLTVQSATEGVYFLMGAKKLSVSRAERVNEVAQRTKIPTQYANSEDPTLVAIPSQALPNIKMGDAITSRRNEKTLRALEDAAEEVLVAEPTHRGAAVQLKAVHTALEGKGLPTASQKRNAAAAKDAEAAEAKRAEAALVNRTVEDEETIAAVQSALEGRQEFEANEKAAKEAAREQMSYEEREALARKELAEANKANFLRGQRFEPSVTESIQVSPEPYLGVQEDETEAVNGVRFNVLKKDFPLETNPNPPAVRNGFVKDAVELQARQIQAFRELAAAGYPVSITNSQRFGLFTHSNSYLNDLPTPEGFSGDSYRFYREKLALKISKLYPVIPTDEYGNLVKEDKVKAAERATSKIRVPIKFNQTMRSRIGVSAEGSYTVRQAQTLIVKLESFRGSKASNAQFDKAIDAKIAEINDASKTAKPDTQGVYEKGRYYKTFTSTAKPQQYRVTGTGEVELYRAHARGFLDPQGHGVFTNDPVLVSEMISQNIPVRIPKEILLNKGPNQDPTLLSANRINPSIKYYEDGTVYAVTSMAKDGSGIVIQQHHRRNQSVIPDTGYSDATAAVVGLFPAQADTKVPMIKSVDDRGTTATHEHDTLSGTERIETVADVLLGFDRFIGAAGRGMTQEEIRNTVLPEEFTAKQDLKKATKDVNALEEQLARAEDEGATDEQVLFLQDQLELAEQRLSQASKVSDAAGSKGVAKAKATAETQNANSAARRLGRMLGAYGPQKLEGSYLAEAMSAFHSEYSLLVHLHGVRTLLGKTTNLITKDGDGNYRVASDYQNKALKTFLGYMGVDADADLGGIATTLAKRMMMASPDFTAGGLTEAEARASQKDIILTYLDEHVLNNVRLREGNMPPMETVARTVRDRYVRQQQGRAAEEFAKTVSLQSFENDEVADAFLQSNIDPTEADANLVPPHMWGIGGRDPFVDSYPEEGPANEAQLRAHAEAIRVARMIEDGYVPSTEPFLEKQQELLEPLLPSLFANANDRVIATIQQSPEARAAFVDLLRRTIHRGQLRPDDSYDNMDVGVMWGTLAGTLTHANHEQNHELLSFLRDLKLGRLESGLDLRDVLKWSVIPSELSPEFVQAMTNHFNNVNDQHAKETGAPLRKGAFRYGEVLEILNGASAMTRRRYSPSVITEQERAAAIEDNTAEAERLGLVSGDPESVVAALQMIADLSGSENHRLVASMLLENPAFLRSVQFHIGTGTHGAAGMHEVDSAGQHTVSLNLAGHNGRGLENVLLEEYVHAATVFAIDSQPEALTKAQKASLSRLEGLMALAKKAYLKDPHASKAFQSTFSNLDEFVAGLVLNPEFQGFVKGVIVPAKQRGLFHRIMDAIVGLFRRGLGFTAVTKVEADQYVEALSDVMDLAKANPTEDRQNSQVALATDLHQAKIEAQVFKDNTKNTPNRNSDLATPEVAARLAAQDEEIARMVAIEKRNQKQAAELVANLREKGTPINLHGETDEQVILRMEQLVAFVRSVLPREVSMVEDYNDDASMQVKGNVLSINPTWLAYEVAGMNSVQARGLISSIMDEELSHVSSYNALHQQEIDELGESLGVDALKRVANKYYYTQEQANQAIERLESADPEVSLAETRNLVEEHLRMVGQKVTRGFTTEEDRAFYRGRPNMLRIIARYIKGKIKALAARRRLGESGTQVRGMVNRLTHELRHIKMGYRSGPPKQLLDPNNPAQNLLVLEAIMGEPVTAEIEQMMGYESSPAALSTAFKPDGLDKLDFGHVPQMFEIPFLEVGPYNAPKTTGGSTLQNLGQTIKAWFTSDTDPRIDRLNKQREAALRGTKQILRSFRKDFDRLLTETYGSVEEAPSDLLSKAIGNRHGVVLSQDIIDSIEDEYTAAITAAQALPTVEEQDEAFAVADLTRVNKQRDAKMKVRDSMLAEQEVAMSQIHQQNPELAQKIRVMRTELIDELSRILATKYNVSVELGIQIDAQMGIYITRSYKMFTEVGYYDKVKKAFDRSQQGKDEDYDTLRNEAVALFESEFIKLHTDIYMRQEGLTEVDARRKAQQKLESNPDYGYQALHSFIDSYSLSQGSGSGLMGKDSGFKPIMDNLKRKNADLPETLRKVLGENNDTVGLENLLRTYATVGSMAANQSFLEHVSMLGQGLHQPNTEAKDRFLFNKAELDAARLEDPETYLHYIPVREGPQNHSDPLGGLYGPPEMVEAFRAMFANNSNAVATTAAAAVDTVTKTASRLTGAAMATKTLGSVGFYIRNVLSNILFFGPSQGYWNVAEMGKNAVKHIAKTATTPHEINAELAKLHSLGVIGDELQSTLLNDLVQGKSSISGLQEQLDTMQGQIQTKENDGSFAKAGEAAKGTAKWLYQKATDMASAVDAFYKMSYYYHELEILKKAKAAAAPDTKYANMTTTQLEREAAATVMATAQTASQAPPIIKELTKSGVGLLFAPFLRFKAEVPRVIINTFKVGMAEYRSGNSVMQKRGVQRMAGMLTVLGTFSAVIPAVLAKLVAGMDDEEEEALRASMPEYLRGHTFFYFRNDKGDLVSWDLTYVNPFAMMVDPFLRAAPYLFKGDFGEAAARFSKGLIMDTYLDDQILASSVASLKENRDPTTGDPIYEPSTDSTMAIFTKSLGHVFNEAYKPDIQKRLEAGYNAWGEDAKNFKDTPLGIFAYAFYPTKPHTVDLDKQFRRFLYERKGEFSRASKRQFAAYSTKPMSNEEVRDLYKDRVRVMKALDEDVARKIRGFIKLGHSPQDIYAGMVKSGFGKQHARNIFHGVMDRPSLSPKFMQGLASRGLLDRARPLFEQYQQTDRLIVLDLD